MGIRISALPAIATPALTDVFPVVQAGVTYKETVTQLNTLLQGSGAYVLMNPISTQTINFGSLQVSAGTVVSGLSIGGQVGAFEAFPSTTMSGYMALQAANNATGNFGTTILNSTAQAQAQALTLPDVGATTGNILATGAALISGNLIQASGTKGAVIDSGFPASALGFIASVALTSAQFTNMYTTPIQLIAAPGANKLIIVDKMEVIMTYVSANYASGGIVGAQYDSTAHLAGVLATNTEAAADFFAAASTTFVFNGTSGNTVGALPFSTTVNKGLYISNQTGVWITGDSTFVVKVHYHIITVA